MTRPRLMHVMIINLLAISALVSSAFVPLADSYWKRKLQQDGKMNLPLHAILQSKFTSCGEAVITMAYNYAYPESQISEQEVIDYATKQGLFTERKWPFTS